jgi:hypothetical protein
MEYEFLCKTFRCCIDEDCDNCPLYDFEMEHCEKQIKLQALSFIILQQADKERLEIELQKAKAEIERLKFPYKMQVEVSKEIENEIKSEAVREFAMRFEKKIKDTKFTLGQTHELQCALSEIKKEMTEKEGGKG